MIKKKVYIVDDEPEMLNILNYYLKKDFDIKIFNNPLILLEEINIQKSDYVITDFYMPEMTGEELVLKIKEKNPEIKVLLMSGSHLETKNKTNFDGFLKKPFSKEDIINYITRI